MCTTHGTTGMEAASHACSTKGGNVSLCMCGVERKCRPDMLVVKMCLCSHIDLSGYIPHVKWFYVNVLSHMCVLSCPM